MKMRQTIKIVAGLGAIVLGMLLLTAGSAQATTYFISALWGNDGYNGLHPIASAVSGEEIYGPFKTIERALAIGSYSSYRAVGSPYGYVRPSDTLVFMPTDNERGYSDRAVTISATSLGAVTSADLAGVTFLGYYLYSSTDPHISFRGFNKDLLPEILTDNGYRMPRLEISGGELVLNDDGITLEGLDIRSSSGGRLTFNSPRTNLWKCYVNCQVAYRTGGPGNKIYDCYFPGAVRWSVADLDINSCTFIGDLTAGSCYVKNSILAGGGNSIRGICPYSLVNGIWWPSEDDRRAAIVEFTNQGGELHSAAGDPYYDHGDYLLNFPWGFDESWLNAHVRGARTMPYNCGCAYYQWLKREYRVAVDGNQDLPLPADATTWKWPIRGADPRLREVSTPLPTGISWVDSADLPSAGGINNHTF